MNGLKKEIREKLESLTKNELLYLARKLKLKGISKLDKGRLKELLVKAAEENEEKVARLLFPAPRKKWKPVFNICAGIASITGLLVGLYTLFYPGPGNDPFTLTVRLRDTGGGVPLQGEGRLNMLLHSGTISREIDKHGEAVFTNIPVKYKNRPVTLELVAPGWQFLVYVPGKVLSPNQVLKINQDCVKFKDRKFWHLKEVDMKNPTKEFRRRGNPRARLLSLDTGKI